MTYRAEVETVDLVVSALGRLAPPGDPFDVAEELVPDRPGLYAIFVDSGYGRRTLGLEEDDRVGPIYVGKAEKSLRSRDLRTHFETGRTGSSTVRRSLAALLREPLDLRAVPRNPEAPGYFSNFSLDAASDARLTDWMRGRLSLATWANPSSLPLRPVEIAILHELQPPLNLTDVLRPWPALKAARRAMAEEAAQFAAGVRPVELGKLQ